MVMTVDVACYCLMIAILICLLYDGSLYARIGLAKIPTFGISGVVTRVCID